MPSALSSESSDRPRPAHDGARAVIRLLCLRRPARVVTATMTSESLLSDDRRRRVAVAFLG
jgi:hypothetical protein